ncbi:SDR family oxidoreductase [Paenibacillus sp. JX-17]|uniref:dTDP-4-dehydrorhamnose reductase n=1 Tax=Paenibacillus lacisoli TaxID=3064525 RepID=A0ABT9CDP4_9BACL|nr:SDR family oxidoreductase [Paenibacillus sp. JX-17]MDO7906985.1 SDR family oxidoreductase [Paenibacillus sp. JX-17]
MKVLILGGTGMLGHVLVQYFTALEEYTVTYTTRNPEDRSSLQLDVTDSQAVDCLIDVIRPHLIINATGVLNGDAQKNSRTAYHVNGFLPHQLRHAADRVGAKLIHVSTDCVFLGDKGGYTEQTLPDGKSVYARTKAIGEVRGERHLTIRTSIIGPEIRQDGIGLLNWFLQQEGEVSGYRHVYWNGITTLELAKAIHSLWKQPVSGLIHLVSPQIISKYELLLLFQEIWRIPGIRIVPSDLPVLDRTLVSTREDVNYSVPGYHEMLKELEEWTRSTTDNPTLS